MQERDPRLAPLCGREDNRIAIFSTCPVEILLAAGLVPADVNNLFVTSPDPLQLLEDADGMGMPAGICAWTRALVGTTVRHRFRRVLVVTRGDCANNAIVGRLLLPEDVEVIPFDYPADGPRRSARLRRELARLMQRLGVDAAVAEATFRGLRDIRELLAAIDRAGAEGRLPASVVRACLLDSTDFGGDPDAFRLRLARTLSEATPGCGGAGLLPANGPGAGDRGRPRVAVFGVPSILRGLAECIESLAAHVVLWETESDFAMIPPAGTLEKQYLAYAYPYGIQRRVARFLELARARRVDGILVYSQAFCQHNLELVWARKVFSDWPMLVVEGDLPGEISARERTRMEAFVEVLS